MSRMHSGKTLKRSEVAAAIAAIAQRCGAKVVFYSWRKEGFYGDEFSAATAEDRNTLRLAQTVMVRALSAAPRHESGVTRLTRWSST